MKREIKFRAWHKESKEMLYPTKLSRQGDVFHWLEEGQPIEIMQCTGLKDRNGKEIYEGDIIVLKKTTSNFDDKTFKVIFESGSFQIKRDNHPLLSFINLAIQLKDHFKLYDMDDLPEFLEVIGNTYENHELLNEAK